jgi:hypothetical protein
MDDEATGKVTGSIAVDKSVKNDIYLHLYDLKITCESGSASSFQVTNTDVLENIRADKLSGTIQRVAKRQAVRYMPEGEDYAEGEDYDEGEDVAITYRQEYRQSIQFENETEAQSILDSYPCGKEPLLCLSNHMQFPVEVSRLVTGFATSKPSPIFFFEEDDLFLTFEWDPSYHHSFATVLVARRRR